MYCWTDNTLINHFLNLKMCLQAIVAVTIAKDIYIYHY